MLLILWKNEIFAIILKIWYDKDDISVKKISKILFNYTIMSTPELSVERKTSLELQNIEREIHQAQFNLEKLKNSENPDFQNQIWELEEKLKTLQEQKEKIISQTQKSLQNEKLWNDDKQAILQNLEHTNLSKTEQKEVKSVLWNQSVDKMGGDIQSWIFALISAILQSFSLGFKTDSPEYAEVTTSENPGKTIKWREKTPKDKENFITQYKDIAKKIGKEFNIPWEFILTQAWLESAWWTSGLATNYNNLFGIKAKKWWKSVLLWTNEEINGRMVRKKEPFRVYDNVEESFRDHAIFLTENPRYKAAFNYPNDPANFAIEVAKAWYATDSRYASKLTSSMKWIA